MFFRTIIALVLALALPAHAATQFDFLLSQVRTSVGSLPGGKVYFYSPGTTTLKTVWVDKNAATVAANPYTLDSNGTALIYGAGGYRIVIKDAAGVTKYDRTYVSVAGDDASINSVSASGGNATFALPSGGSVTVCKTDATGNTVTISPSVGGHTIAGLSSYVLYVQYETVTLALDGTTWYIK